MKMLKFLFLILLYASCSSTKHLRVTDCNENMTFKKAFFYNISIAEKYTLEHTKPIEHTIETNYFLKSLNFISKYTNVSMDKVSNYQIGYPTFEVFEIDKKEWIKWYNDNKCNNLKE